MQMCLMTDYANPGRRPQLILGVLSHWPNVRFCPIADLKLMSAFPLKADISQCLIRGEIRTLGRILKTPMFTEHSQRAGIICV